MRQAARLARQLAVAAEVHRRCRPLALQEVQRWATLASTVPDPELRRHALSSLHRKRFHCEGAAAYGARVPAAAALVGGICALQILVDYLDNLSDRCGPLPEERLRRLHLAVDDALTPGAPLRDYYSQAQREDGGYLAELVRTCQARLGALPGYGGDVQAAARHLGALYADLQVYKHLPSRAEREARLTSWLAPLQMQHPGWQWWELAAACGSTLGVFALLNAAARPDGQRWAPALHQAYFPWIGGLHILLDYYIDQEEDARGGDLNFVRYYGGTAPAVAGLLRIRAGAAARARTLPQAELHELVVAGLPGLYLSDPKVKAQRLGAGARRLLWAGGALSMGAWCYCRLHPPGR